VGVFLAANILDGEHAFPANDMKLVQFEKDTAKKFLMSASFKEYENAMALKSRQIEERLTNFKQRPIIWG